MMEHNDEAASQLSETHLPETKTAPKNVYNTPIKRPFKTTLYDIQHKKTSQHRKDSTKISYSNILIISILDINHNLSGKINLKKRK